MDRESTYREVNARGPDRRLSSSPGGGGYKTRLLLCPLTAKGHEHLFFCLCAQSAITIDSRGNSHCPPERRLAKGLRANRDYRTRR